MNIICPNCGHVYKKHSNIYGKTCSYCFFNIEAELEVEVVKKNKEKKQNLVKKAKKAVRKKFLK